MFSDFCRDVKEIQLKMRTQALFNKCRRNKIFSTFSIEREEYTFKLSTSKNKDDPALYKTLTNGTYNFELERRLVLLYLERCKFKHSLAFVQFRRMLPNAKQKELIEMFSGRKDYMLRYLEKVNNMVDAGFITAKFPRKKESIFDKSSNVQENMVKRGWGDVDVTEFKKTKAC